MRTISIDHTRSRFTPNAFGIILPLGPDEVRTTEAAVRERNKKHEETPKEYELVAIIDRAWKDARDAGYPFFKKKPFKEIGYWRQHSLQLLASPPGPLLECFLGEGVAPCVSFLQELREFYNASGDEISDHSAWVQRYGQAFAPCHYVRELVNKNNESPTPEEIERAI
jgi:hypothetical protein